MTLLSKLNQTAGLGMLITPERCVRVLACVFAVSRDSRRQVLHICSSRSQPVPHHTGMWSVCCFYKPTVGNLKHRLSVTAVRKGLTIPKPDHTEPTDLGETHVHPFSAKPRYVALRGSSDHSMAQGHQTHGHFAREEREREGERQQMEGVNS